MPIPTKQVVQESDDRAMLHAKRLDALVKEAKEVNDIVVRSLFPVSNTYIETLRARLSTMPPFNDI